MTLFEAMKASHHIDEDGMILEDPNAGDGPNTGNGWHGWGILSCLLHARNEVVTEEIRELFFKCYNESVVNGYPGLVHRGPRKTEELIAHDDIIGFGVTSKYIDSGLMAALAFSHLKSSYGCYNNLEPGKWTARSFQMRHPSVLPALAGSALNGSGLGCAENFMAKAVMVTGSLSSSPRGRIIDWMVYKALEDNKDESVIRAREQWKQGLFKIFPKGMRDVFSAYHGADHPFVEYGVGC